MEDFSDNDHNLFPSTISVFNCEGNLMLIHYLAAYQLKFKATKFFVINLFKSFDTFTLIAYCSQSQTIFLISSIIFSPPLILLVLAIAMRSDLFISLCLLLMLSEC